MSSLGRRLSGLGSSVLFFAGVLAGCSTSPSAGAAHSAIPGTLSLGGTVEGLQGTGLTLATPGEPNLVISPGATSFTFGNLVALGASYNVTIVSEPSVTVANNPTETQTCTVGSGTGTATADVTDIAVSCSCPSEPMYAVGATSSCSVSLSPEAGATIIVPSPWTGGCSGESASCDVNIVNNQIELTPSLQMCPALGCMSLIDTQYVNCTFFTPAAGTYTVTFPTGPGTTGEATVNIEPGGSSLCSLSSTQYSVGGNITGLQGTGLTLATEGEPPLVVAPGATNFTFADPLPVGSTYSVSVLDPPTNPSEPCQVTNGSGTVSPDGVEVSVACGCSTQGAYIVGVDGTYCGSARYSAIYAPVKLSGCSETASCVAGVSGNNIVLIPTIETCPQTVCSSCAGGCTQWVACTLPTHPPGNYTVTYPDGPGTTGTSGLTEANVNENGAISCYL